jgi:hypothetical protein
MSCDNSEVKDINDSFIYEDEKFDPAPSRKLLGLDGCKAADLPKHEKERIANLLFRNGKLTIKEITELGAWRVQNPDYDGEGQSTRVIFDLPPSADNKHLQR